MTQKQDQPVTRVQIGSARGWGGFGPTSAGEGDEARTASFLHAALIPHLFRQTTRTP